MATIIIISEAVVIPSADVTGWASSSWRVNGFCVIQMKYENKEEKAIQI